MPTSARPTAFRVKCLWRRPFFLRRKKRRKERRQNQGFEILSAAEVLPVPASFSHANQDKQISCLAFTWPLRLHLRCAPRLCWPILTGLFSASLVGRGAHTPRPNSHDPLVPTCHCEPVTDVTGVAIRALCPVPAQPCRGGRPCPPYGNMQYFAGRGTCAPPSAARGHLRKKRPPLWAVSLCVAKFEASQIQL